VPAMAQLVYEQPSSIWVMSNVVSRNDEKVGLRQILKLYMTD
jgi:hypothetical protein